MGNQTKQDGWLTTRQNDHCIVILICNFSSSVSVLAVCTNYATIDYICSIYPICWVLI